jgi:serine phosphatase RsbU (regulator of sigma subunit)
MGRDDTLVLYTDGVTEARSRGGEFFGDERLAAALSESQGVETDVLARRLGAMISDFTNGRLSDDVAIVTLSLE